MTAEAGDIVTHALAWSSTIRLGGVQISRDFSVRPDIVTYPLPQFSGQASVPTSVDLLINGVQSMHSAVQPGPYSLTDLPYINGAGEATVVTTDALGRRVETSVPFYVASTLLRPGYTDYTVAVARSATAMGWRISTMARRVSMPPTAAGSCPRSPWKPMPRRRPIWHSEGWGCSRRSASGSASSISPQATAIVPETGMESARKCCPRMGSNS